MASLVATKGGRVQRGDVGETKGISLVSSGLSELSRILG